MGASKSLPIDLLSTPDRLAGFSKPTGHEDHMSVGAWGCWEHAEPASIEEQA